MKYIRNFEAYKNFKNSDETLNEEFLSGLLGKAFGFFKNMASKRKQLANKVKGIKEVDAIYNQYLGIISDLIQKQSGIDLQLRSEEELLKIQQQPKKSNENLLIKEADDAPVIKNVPGEKGDDEETEKNVKLSSKDLTAKKAIIQKIMDSQKLIAKNKMNAVLKKYAIKDKDGKTQENEELREYIDSKLKDFDIALLNAELAGLDEVADKSMITKITQQRTSLQKEVSASLDKIISGRAGQIKIGDKTFSPNKKYRYKTEDGIKTILFIGESEEEGKIKASYVYGDSAGKEQNFSVENVEMMPKDIEVGTKFGYYSENNKAVIDVEIVGKPENGMISVKTGKSEFNIEVGALIDKEEEEKK